MDVLHGRIFKIDPAGNFEVFVEYDGWPNGLKFHKDGRLFVADSKRGILTVDMSTRRVTPLVERYHLEHLKAPNDLVFASNGDLYFTDQGLTGLQEPAGRLYRLRNDSRLELLLSNIPSPNGLVLDGAERAVYVAATRQNAIWRVPLMKDGTVAKVGIHIQMSGGVGPDGLAIDQDDNLAIAHVGLGCVWVFDRRGEPVLRINSCEGHHTTNLAYGGPDMKTLFITESESGVVLQADLAVPGRTMFSHH